MKLVADRNTVMPSGRDYYHEVDRNSDTLVIALGDSWTWGDRLGRTTLKFDDRLYRTAHNYGAVIANTLECDLINLGFPGQSNFHIMNMFMEIFPTITRSYKKCHVLFTLTEPGREIPYMFQNQREHYNELRGESWPEFDHIMSRQATDSSIEFARDEMLDRDIKFVYHYNLIVDLLKSTSVNDFFIRYERWMFETIQREFNQLPRNVHWHIARSFTSVRSENISVLPVNNLSTDCWVDIIAEQGSLSPYPHTVDVLSKLGLDPIIELSTILGIDSNREDWLNVFSQSEKAISWLSSSPYNNQSTTNHPTEQAHAWWAEHLLSKIQ